MGKIAKFISEIAKINTIPVIIPIFIELINCIKLALKLTYLKKLNQTPKGKIMLDATWIDTQEKIQGMSA